MGPASSPRLLVWLPRPSCICHMGIAPPAAASASRPSFHDSRTPFPGAQRRPSAGGLARTRGCVRGLMPAESVRRLGRARNGHGDYQTPPRRVDANIIPSQLRFLAMPPMSEIAAVKQPRASAVASHSSHGSRLQRRGLMGGGPPAPASAAGHSPANGTHGATCSPLRCQLDTGLLPPVEASCGASCGSAQIPRERRQVRSPDAATRRKTLFSDDSRQIMLIESTGGQCKSPTRHRRLSAIGDPSRR